MPQDPIGGVIQNLLLLQRLGNTANADVQPLIEGLFDEIVAAVAKLDPTSPPQETYRRQRLEAFVGEVESLAGGTFEDVRKTLRERMVDIGLLQAKWAEGQLERALGSVAVDIKSGRLGVNAMKAIIDSQPFEGFLLSEWAEGQSELVVKRVHREVQFGMAQHETLDDIIRRIRGRATGAPTRDEDGRITGYRFSGGVLETTTRETEALARTAVAFIANEGQVATWTENADILKALEVVATLDERTTEICMAKDGLTTDPADPDPKLIPPFHFRCLPGDSLVLTRTPITGASERWFDGDVVVVRTAAGRELTCTPNHPILTPEGFVPAHILHVGCYVVCDGGSEWPPASHRDDENAPARIQDVARATLRSSQMFSMPVPVSSEDFHGDGIDGQVAVVAAECFLEDHRAHPPGVQHRRKAPLVLADTRFSTFSGAGGLAELLGARGASPCRGVRGSDETLAGRPVHPGHPRSLLLTPVPKVDSLFPQGANNYGVRAAHALRDPAGTDPGLVQRHDPIDGQVHLSKVPELDTALPQDASNDLVRDAHVGSDRCDRFAAEVSLHHFRAVEPDPVAPDPNTAGLQPVGDGLHATAELASQIIRGASGPVFADEVVDVEVKRFSDHVYNLETVGGFYTADGIITHNCRTVTVPVVDWEGLGIEPPPEGKRASRNGPVPGDWTYEDWLKQQSPALQDEILGPGRAKLFRDGKLSLRDLIRDDNELVPLEELRKS